MITAEPIAKETTETAVPQPVQLQPKQTYGGLGKTTERGVYIQALANNSPSGKRAQTLQRMANNSPPAIKARAWQAKADAFSARKAKKQITSLYQADEYKLPPNPQTQINANLRLKKNENEGENRTPLNHPGHTDESFIQEMGYQQKGSGVIQRYEERRRERDTDIAGKLKEVRKGHKKYNYTKLRKNYALDKDIDNVAWSEGPSHAEALITQDRYVSRTTNADLTINLFTEKKPCSGNAGACKDKMVRAEEKAKALPDDKRYKLEHHVLYASDEQKDNDQAKKDIWLFYARSLLDDYNKPYVYKDIEGIVPGVDGKNQDNMMKALNST
ncbi:MAG: hypothetical protein ACMUJM_18755 [bacterium]